jgi:ribosomal protein S18 acetylase RimI-like enzyme
VEVLNESWGSTRVVSRGILHRADILPGLIAEIAGERVGLLTYNIHEGMLEIVTLNVQKQKQGIGKALVERVGAIATSQDCSRVWVITTNDNKPAMEFYKAIGFTLVKVHKDSIMKSRKLKPEIPQLGIDGIPITDEVEFEKI